MTKATGKKRDVMRAAASIAAAFTPGNLRAAVAEAVTGQGWAGQTAFSGWGVRSQGPVGQRRLNQRQKRKRARAIRSHGGTGNRKQALLARYR